MKRSITLQSATLALSVGICLAFAPLPNGPSGSAEWAVAWNPRAAANYLDTRQTWWQSWPRAARDHGTSCISCHTALPYALARPALRPLLRESGPTPAEATLTENVERRVRLWDEVEPYYPDQTVGLPKTSESRGTEAILNAMVLSTRDARAARLSTETRRAFDHLWKLQFRRGERTGSWAWLQFGLAPWESVGAEYFGAALAAVAVGEAPDDYATAGGVQDRLDMLRAYLLDEGSRSTFDAVMLLWAASALPDLLTPDRADSVVARIMSLQNPDGGWSLATLGPWERRDGAPPALESDGYATGLVAYVLQRTGISPAQDDLSAALTWLAANQDPVGGGWPASSLNRDRDPDSDAGRFMADAATAFAVLALTEGATRMAAPPAGAPARSVELDVSERGVEESDWSYFGGDRAFQRYAPLDQINRDNVDRLEVAWRRSAVDPVFESAFPDRSPPGNLRSTPILIDGALYAPNALGLVEAFDPGTGLTIWRQRPFDGSREELNGRSSRGVDHWRGDAGDRLLSVRGPYLYALDPASGATFPDFGDGGRVDLIPSGALNFSWSSGPIVVGDVVVIGGVVDGAGDSGSRWRGSAPENVRGYDVRTGRLLWTFHVVPREGEFGFETWGDGSGKDSGDLGAWCCLSADEDLGYVYVPFTAPTAAYYGGHRPGDNLFSNSLVAIDAATGERVWHFQMVHHDLWEYDTVGPPTLGDISVEGRLIRAVMQPSKTGFLYVFDRATGEPVWPIEERPVPRSTVPGEHTAPTQPFPTKPAPFAQHGVAVDDLIDFTPELRARARAIADSFVMGGIFTPPSLVSDPAGGKGGTLSLPGSWGAGNWNTGAFDPETGFYYAFAHEIPRVYRIEESTEAGSEMAYWSPNRDAPYIEGLPITKPPWGRITAIDMNSGEHAWSAANGRGLEDHPLLRDLDLPALGIASRPAPLLTKTLLFMGDGGNVFGGVQPNMWGRGFRAYDKATGDVIWETELPTGVTGAPMTYMHDGRQYIVVAIGGREDPPEWVALGLR